MNANLGKQFVLAVICSIVMSGCASTSNPWIAYLQGVNNMRQGNMKEAIKFFNQTIELDSHFVSAFTDRADCEIQMGDYAKAVESINRALQIDPACGHAFFLRGDAYEHLGDYRKAEEDLTEAIRLNKKHAGSYSARGLTFLKRYQYPKAIEDFNAALALDASDKQTLCDLSQAYIATGDYEKAIATANKVIDADEKYFLGYVAVAAAYDAEKKYDQAIYYSTRAVSLAPTSPIPFNQRGLANLHSGKAKESVEDFFKAISADPKFGEAYFNRAQAYQRLGKSGPAAQDLQESRTLGYKPAPATKDAKNGQDDKAKGKAKVASKPAKKHK